MTDEDQSVDTPDHRDIPRHVQDISTDELIANDYNVPDIPDIPDDHRSATDGGGQPDHHVAWGAFSDPGRTRHDDSIHASSNDEQRRARQPDDHDYSAGPEMTAATGVGKPDDPHYDEDLHRLNDGRHQSDGKLSHRQSIWDKKRITQAMCSDLPISKRQRETVVLAMQNLDLDRFGHQKAIERVCLGVVAVIVNDEREEQVDDPTEFTSITWEDEFKNLADKYDVGMSDLTTIKKLVRKELGDRPPIPGNAGVRRDENLPRIPLSERPDEYWEAHPSQYWVALARTWDRRDNELKTAIPEAMREIIDLLRRWKPWERTDKPSEEQKDSAVESPIQESDDERELNAALDIDLESLDDAVEEEAKSLLEQIELDAQRDT